MAQETENWQVEVKGQIYETNFEELTEWISEGALLRGDRVRRGNLRWLEAGRIPKLISFFNAKDQNLPAPVIPSTSEGENTKGPEIAPENSFTNLNQFDNAVLEQSPIITDADDTKPNPDQCAVHPAEPSYFECETCFSRFCISCPKTYCGTVKTCPLCGARCKEIEPVAEAGSNSFDYLPPSNGGFGFGDFSAALAYPFKFKTSLIFGAIMFAFFTLGQSASAIGGIIMLCAAIFCMMLSNMLTFGILANTVESFSQGRVGGNFMPAFDDFELWNDVIEPFFLSIGAYLVSFGLFIVIIAGGIWYVAGSVSRSLQDQSVSAAMPEMRHDLQSAKSIPQIGNVREQLNKDNIWEDGDMPDENGITGKQQLIDNEEAEFRNLQNMIDEHRRGQLESFAAENTESQQAQYAELFGNLATFAFPFILLAFLAILWGLFYFPAACLVAGYTRSFGATLNPLIGLDTIRRLGIDYVKILFMGLVLIIAAGVFSAILAVILSPFDMPMMGNIPAKFIGSFATFYISIVFSVTLGFAMYRNSHKFKLSAR